MNSDQSIGIRQQSLASRKVTVVSAVLATVLAMQIGFSGVILAAVMLYLVAVAVTPPLRIGGVTVGGPSGSLQRPILVSPSRCSKADNV